MTVTKADIINKVHKAHPRFNKTQAQESVETILKLIKTNLENGNDVLISGFGKFIVKDKSARKGRNPKTGESITLKARKVVTFKPSNVLRKNVAGK